MRSFLAISLSRENLHAHSLIIYDDANTSVFVKAKEACLLTEKPNFSENLLCVILYCLSQKSELQKSRQEDLRWDAVGLLSTSCIL
jgi:hypothetical protein